MAGYLRMRRQLMRSRGPTGPTLAFRASATSTAETITVPASAAAGDLAVLIDYAVNVGSTPTSVVPTDWTSIASAASSSSRSRSVVSYKILDGTEAGNSITGMNGDLIDAKVLLVFSGGLASATPSTWNAETTGDAPAEQTVLASGGVAPLVVIAAAGSNANMGTFTTATPAFDATLNEAADPNDFLLVGYKVYQSGPQDHAIAVADAAARNYLASGYIQIA